VTAPGGSATPADTEITRQAWLALAVTTLVTFLVVIDISAVNVAFPSIEEDLSTDRATLSWIISGYNIMVGALLLASGRLADSVGRKKVFLPGVALFGVSGLLDRCSTCAGRWWCGRRGFVICRDAARVPPARRSTAIGFAGATGALGAVVGPALGSVLIDAFDWRAIFLINVPLSLLVLAIAPRFLRDSRIRAQPGESTGSVC